MKTPGFSTRIVGFTLALALALGGLGCGNAAQQQAYEQAVKAEQQLTAENAPAVRAAYQRVIALQPDSACARQARARLAVVEARVQAEELRKSVFHEHGVD